MMEKTVYCIRHGQTAENIGTTFQPPDAPLNETGKEQALKIAERISKLSFDILFASHFERAKETAGYIAEASQKELHLSDLFIERVKPSSINGKPFSDSVAHKTWSEWHETLYQPGTRVEDGENFDDLMARADRALGFLLARPEQHIVVVTHGFFLRTMVARVLHGKVLTGELFRNIQTSLSMENTGLTVLQYRAEYEQDSAWRLWVYNDHAHL